MHEKYYWGVDPGSVVMGYAILDKSHQLCNFGTLSLKGSDAEKYKFIFLWFEKMLQEYPAIRMGIEAPFYGKNVQSMMKLARSQSVVITCAALANVEYREYAPRFIKQWITGNGAADKTQVAQVLQRKFAFSTIPEKKDATDALAIAVCCAMDVLPIQLENQKNKKFKDWEDFYNKNSK